MGTGRWGIERYTEEASTESLGWTGEAGEGEGEEEDHVAGLVEQIAHAMLEEDEEEIKQARLWRAEARVQSEAQVSAINWEKKRVESVRAGSILPAPVQNRVEGEAMELLYMELVRLKMEELAAAQQQLSFYQKAIFDARQSPHSSFASADGLSNMASSLMVAEQNHTFDTCYKQQLHAHSARGGEWAAPNMMQFQRGERGSGQRLVAPLVPNGRYPARAVFLGLPTSRESGGTGVFLPRCRTGVRHLRNLDSKPKPEFESQASRRCTEALIPNKRKENVEDMPSLQYPSCSPLQEVAPDISLPTEWTY
eukprot:c19903_g1_i1 orf=505-1431(-)